jgi:hypothetical protein
VLDSVDERKKTGAGQYGMSSQRGDDDSRGSSAWASSFGAGLRPAEPVVSADAKTGHRNASKAFPDGTCRPFLPPEQPAEYVI